ncbi:MAG: tRNA (adenosine(37)-N6)-threonylcarbamoyltransferase complex dimerization subunit type 1 TsaB [Lachnospiraceae bacterium]|nr:tRNA (adenosine(37)-N6)-threonylcarbamoyltransferase complex dimerization subunit type 1 TsaB [Lachnospiraceae bacterium]
MKILALDSSGLVASVAVTENGVLTAEYTVNYKKTHSQTLLPMLQTIKEMLELDLDTIDGIAVAAGPGSFTGLRIGSATAKGLGLALDKPMIEVSTLAGLAYNLWGSDKLICPIMDARRGQVYTGVYTFKKAGEAEEKEDSEAAFAYRMETVISDRAEDIEELIERLNALGKEVIFLGDGVPVFWERIKNLSKVPCTYAPAHANRQRAAAIAALGEQYYAEGRIVTADAHQPEYLRMSQAERERLEQEQERQK